MTVSYCRDISEAKDVAAVWQSAERQHLCARCYCTYEDMVVGRESLRPVVAKKMQTRRSVKELQEEPGNLAEKCHNKRRR